MNTQTATAATHKRVKTGEKVIVTREYDILIVRNMRGKVLGSYDGTQVATFHKRYKKLEAVKGR